MENKLRDFGALVGRLSTGDSLSREEAHEAYRQIVLNEQPELQQGAFLAAHQARGATIDELCGAWEALDTYDTAKIDGRGLGVVCDIVGTGSDNIKTVNCSSPASLIAAACGLAVAKKGARKVTGMSGATCIFEALGIDVSAPLEHAEKSLHRHGFCFLPGEVFLKSGWARLIRSMRFTSVFNIVGPLTRPCPQTTVSIVGGYSPQVCDQMVKILHGLTMEYAACPYGMVDGMAESFGMDEFSLCGATRVVILNKGSVDVQTVRPEDFGLATRPLESIASRASAAENAAAILETLHGRGTNELAEFFAMNAAAALVGAKKVSSWREGTEKALFALRNGHVAQKLRLLKDGQNGKCC